MLDKSLIHKVKSGDRKSFNMLCSELYLPLISYARVFLSEEWAEDVVQDVFFSIWQKRENLNENFSIENYLFRSVRNGAINYLKLKRHSDNYREWNYNRIASVAMTASDLDKEGVLRKLYDGDLRRNINAALETLSPRQREIFELSYLEELSTKEIAERLGLSVRTVESHLYEGLRTLKSLFSSEGMKCLVGVSMLSFILTSFN